VVLAEHPQLTDAERTMRQLMSVLTIGVKDLARSRSFYTQGFGWTPVFENDEIVFYQMNGFMLGTWLASALAADAGRPQTNAPGAFTMAHNVAQRDDVQPAMNRLIENGGVLLRAPVAPPHGGFSGYVTDPDGHAWEIAWNPAWPIDAEGRVTFGV
jgi:catechol 2,3-dioxygenase-like lactoylglutathione lyase family enzyme